ncbi:TIGR00289 family protein [Geoglobus acetivorans]|uniref:TIGR00289 family protein n=1 Tax=Geoglobus acetivorans TaxID=565033 RepID=A0ABZ3H5C6_GEOAI|nr:TIGR00289 family protein [Geoglobus acetivorans]
MKVACFISGGKDSMLALHRVSEEHEIACVVSVISENPDSYMFHTANLPLVDAIASSLKIPLFKVFVSGEEEKEVDELSEQLRALDVDGIVTGAVKSEYQRKRFEKVARRMDARLIAPLWHIDERCLLKEVSEKFEAIIVKVSAMGLDRTFLGKKIDHELIETLSGLSEKYGINISGEGGEYETLVLNAPLFRKRIVIEDFVINEHDMVSSMDVKAYRLENKDD